MKYRTGAMASRMRMPDVDQNTPGCLWTTTTGEINLYVTPEGNRNGVVLGPDTYVVSAPRFDQQQPDGTDWLFVEEMSSNDPGLVGFINKAFTNYISCFTPANS